MKFLAKSCRAALDFFVRLYQGKVPLPVTFWYFFVLLGWFPATVAEVPIYFLFWLMFVSAATWHSASRHKNQAAAIPAQILAIIGVGISSLFAVVWVLGVILSP